MTTLYRSYESVPVRAAVRFPLHLEIVLRTAEREYPGMTEDVSANGLLFVAREVPPVGAVVQFEITMPAAVMGSLTDVLLHCVGRIVRHQQAEGKCMAAAVIDEYSFRG
ncbi:MAG: PilZ domain-containing protein [Acidobacteriaceae bacterium]